MKLTRIIKAESRRRSGESQREDKEVREKKDEGEKRSERKGVREKE